MLPIIVPDTILQQRYRILNLLEEGGLVRIYLATDLRRADAYCAIEELTPGSQFPSVVAKAKELFKREVALLSQLEHLQLPRFWTVFEEQNRLFLVRDYIAGKTYGQKLAERRDLGTAFSQVEVWQFLLQILPVIGYIHSKGVIHRAISPEHIIHRDRDNLPVPIDFGIVAEFGHKLQADPAHQSSASGQSSYAPAEQINSERVYPHSDLYALAVTAIVLLTGKEPSALFAGDRLNWGWREWTQIDDQFAHVLGKMLNPQPQDRYQSAIEVDRDLQSLKIPTSPQPGANPPLPGSTNPTVAIGNNAPSVGNRVQTAITNLNVKSAWEQPQVFIPLGVLIALLAGIGSWFGVTQLLHRQSSPENTASQPAKQLDFNNPTIPTDTSSPSPNSSDTIQPEIDQAIVKEGTVDPTTPVRYKIAAVAGQNFDIQLVPPTTPTVDGTKTTPPTDPTQSFPSPSPSPSTSPSQTKASKSNSSNPPISVPAPLAATQVLMTIMSPTGKPIDSQADRVVGWRGQVPTSGDYTIELRPIKGLTGNSFPYKLSVTQLAISPTAPSPSPITPPTTGSTAPLGIPIPIGGNGIKAIPANPNPNPANLPTVSPTPVPIEIPTTSPKTPATESERPVRTRKRKRARIEPLPPAQERDRVKSSDETTPIPRRRRQQIESRDEAIPTPRRRKRIESKDEATSTPRRRERQNNAESTPKPSSAPNPDVSDNPPSRTPTPEPSIGIPVPAAKNATPPPKTDGDPTVPSPGSGAIDPD